MPDTPSPSARDFVNAISVPPTIHDAWVALTLTVAGQCDALDQGDRRWTDFQRNYAVEPNYLRSRRVLEYYEQFSEIGDATASERERSAERLLFAAAQVHADVVIAHSLAS